MNREEIVAVGDSYNDLSMIQFAGLGVAMGNAQEPVKKAADYITLSNEGGRCSCGRKQVLYKSTREGGDNSLNTEINKKAS